ncbi:ADP-ribosylglycohydrolase family protein [Ideonella sp. DXS29W]|uniref:ADP-ribosylglycohydrolase family protein n=1 Tax=Ideonella lacteola TaxID=2984193 RepID=A0ABU9BHX8_9BURK
MSDSLLLDDRYAGCLLGLACGDAVGTTVEFSPRGTFAPLTDMVGGGPFGLPPGYWTDDTSMALCLAESLISQAGFDAADQMGRYLNWWTRGYQSSTGVCFDIGTTVQSALNRYREDGQPYAGSTHPASAGNGSLMRLAPVVLFFHPGLADQLRYAEESSRTTHAAPEAVACCRLLATWLSRAVEGRSKDEVLAAVDGPWPTTAVALIASGAWTSKSVSDITGSGYAVESLEAAAWCFAQTDSFAAAVLAAANLGNDADTTAAITGQLAGAFYGRGGIPAAWLKTLHRADDIERTALALRR